MPKNPVRAARQSGRQEVRAAKQTSKVAKIQSRTQTKVAKIQGRSGTPAAATTPAPKFKTAAELKSTIKMPDFKARALEMTKEKAKANGTGSKAPVAKAAPVKKSTPKAKTPAPVKKENPAVELALAKKKYEDWRTEQQKGTYITKPEDRNPQQKTKVKTDRVKKIVDDFKVKQDKFFNDAKKKQEATRKALNERRAKSGLPPMKMGGSAHKYGGMKGKKC